MPPPAPGGTKKKKKGRPPKHQNSFAFRHNPKSKKTEKILASPNVGVCRRCYEKIEWRKKYRKYKPLSQPGKCNQCHQRNISAAYHTICTSCACSDVAINSMIKRQQDASGEYSGSSCPTTITATIQSNSCEFETNNVSLPIDDENQEVVNAESVISSVVETAGDDNERKLPSRLRIRVCAVCTNEPAVSKYSNSNEEDIELVESIQKLEDALESGLHVDDGHKMTLRELKGVERKIEKYQKELKQRQSKAKKANDEGEEEAEDLDNDENENESDIDDAKENISDDDSDSDTDFMEKRQVAREYETDDPFLLATGGKALVGEAYQKMLLAKEQQNM